MKPDIAPPPWSVVEAPGSYQILDRNHDVVATLPRSTLVGDDVVAMERATVAAIAAVPDLLQLLVNELRSRVAQQVAEPFRRGLVEWNPAPPAGVDPLVHVALKAAMESQLADLERDIKGFETFAASLRVQMRKGGAL